MGFFYSHSMDVWLTVPGIVIAKQMLNLLNHCYIKIDKVGNEVIHIGGIPKVY